ncbi:hypothetical protein EV132_1384 [Rhizobium sullae]|uniref:Uncharacterized protein n=1 Tax=Rhizobium sullae TaxID=50338 RepID=A0A4R3PR12_RHISU|nr:hypothetical protein EV132_1384 [Rhizobium sullae]
MSGVPDHKDGASRFTTPSEQAYQTVIILNPYRPRISLTDEEGAVNCRLLRFFIQFGKTIPGLEHTNHPICAPADVNDMPWV